MHQFLSDNSSEELNYEIVIIKLKKMGFLYQTVKVHVPDKAAAATYCADSDLEASKFF